MTPPPTACNLFVSVRLEEEISEFLDKILNLNAIPILEFWNIENNDIFQVQYT